MALGGEMWADKVGWWSAHRDVSSGEWPGEGLARHDLILAEGLAYFAHPRRAKGHAQTLNLRATWPSTTHHRPLGGAKWSVSPFPETWKILCLCASMEHMATSELGAQSEQRGGGSFVEDLAPGIS